MAHVFLNHIYFSICTLLAPIPYQNTKISPTLDIVQIKPVREELYQRNQHILPLPRQNTHTPPPLRNLRDILRINTNTHNINPQLPHPHCSPRPLRTPQ
jgi:hypothetical protein